MKKAFNCLFSFCCMTFSGARVRAFPGKKEIKKLLLREEQKMHFKPTVVKKIQEDDSFYKTSLENIERI